MTRLALASLMFVPLAWSGVAAAAEAPPTLDQMVVAAAKEGKVTAMLQAPNRPETIRALTTAFNQRFKLAIQVDWVVAPITTTNTRAIAEAAGGKLSIDVVGPGAVEDIAVAAKANLVRPYPWSEMFGATFPQIPKLEALMLPEFKGDALPYLVVAYGLAWNPEMIKDQDVPENLVDLVEAKWRGKLGVNSFFLTPIDVVSYAMGQPQTLEFARKIVANAPVYERGTPAVARAVTTGEVPLGITVSPIAFLSMRQKEPLKFKLFADYIPVSQQHLYVPDAAPHPNAARLFAAWLVSDGVKIADAFEPLSSPVDPDSDIVKMIDARVKDGAKVAAPKSTADLAASQKLREEISQLLTGQVSK